MFWMPDAAWAGLPGSWQTPSGAGSRGIDLSPDYIEAARILTRRTGLADRVQFETGSILALPEDIGPFDVILCQHILMNISDKPAAVRQFPGTSNRTAPWCCMR